MDLTSTVHMFFDACQVYDKRDAVLVKQGGRFKRVSHRFFRQRVTQMGRGLIAMGIEPGGRLAIMSDTCFEWGIADLAIAAIGCTSVPVYPSLFGDQLAFILKDSQVSGVIVGGVKQMKRVLRVKSQCPDLRFIAVMGEIKNPPEGVITMRDIENRGNRTDNELDFQERRQAVKGGDLFSIIYTSGTTGQPKGVMLSHANIMANIASCASVLPCGPEDVCLSHLPLSHILERMGGFYSMIHKGVTIAFAESTWKLPENLLEIRPTIMISVPKLFERIYKHIISEAPKKGYFQKKAFSMAMETAQQALPYLESNQPLKGWLAAKYAIADKTVFSKIREQAGGRLRWVLSGGAPLAREIHRFYLSVGIKMLAGYGLTETSPVLTIHRLDNIKPGTVGQAVDGVRLKIANDGEILAKGPNIMLGYYNQPKETAEVLEADGWLHTGDIGVLDEEKHLRITDRKRDILVTSGGKSLAPRLLEKNLMVSRYIEHAVVLGEGRGFVSALIVPPWRNVKEWAPFMGWVTDPEKLAHDEGFLKFLAQEIENQTQGFAAFEKIKRFAVVPTPFGVKTGELTPNDKVRRKEVIDKYKDLVEALYQETKA